MLDTLAVEVLSSIIGYIQTAHDLSSLSSTCKRLHRLVEEDGWRIFVLNRFPSIATPPFWKDGAHALSTLSRNLDRRAFIGSELQPRQVSTICNGQCKEYWSKPLNQTMGYQSILDSYDVPLGQDWSQRKEVVAWGAGADLVLKRTSMSPKGLSSSHASDGSKPAKPEHEWWAYEEQRFREGFHDITSINLLRPEHLTQYKSSSSKEEEVIVGRANGELELVALWATGRDIRQNYDTAGEAVRSTDLGPSGTNLLAACLGNHGLSIYPLNGNGEELTAPRSSVSSGAEDEASCRSWTVTFLSSDKVAIARGPSRHIVHVYSIAEDGLRKEPLRRFGCGPSNTAKPTRTSAYPLITLPGSLDTDHKGAENCLLSGGYDGRIRLHDLRSQEDCELTICDPIDRTSVFSLAAIGRERIIAGSSMNALVKIFDLRMIGGRAYSYMDPSHAVSNTARDQDTSQTYNGNWFQRDGDAVHSSGFNMFTYESRRAGSSRGGGGYQAQRQAQSPVYSLSRPSSSSPILYVGLENTVNRINFTSMYDEHPDPLFKNSIQRYKHSGDFDAVRTWWADRSTSLSLSLYEQLGTRKMRILNQRVPTFRGKHHDQPREPLCGYDERLCDAQEEKTSLTVRSRPRQRGR